MLIDVKQKLSSLHLSIFLTKNSYDRNKRKKLNTKTCKNTSLLLNYADKGLLKSFYSNTSSVLNGVKKRIDFVICLVY